MAIMKPTARPVRGVGGLGLDRLVLYIAGQRIVEVPLVAVDLEAGRPNVSVREELLDLPGVWIGEGDKGFFRATEVERCRVPLHRIFETFHVTVYVCVEQAEEETEVIRVALVRRRRH